MLLALAAVLPPVGVATASTRPNIVFVLVDDADAALLEEMPNISSLIVDQGIRFERFYATQAQCCPSRSTLFTGEFVHNHNVRSNNKSEGGYARFLKEGHEERTVARELQQHSYRTGLFGKYLNHYGPRTGSARHVPPFWDRWFAPFNQSKYDYKVNDRGHVRTFGDRRRDYSTNAIGHISQKWITQNVGRPEPLFAYISYLAPHSPYVDPPGHRNDYKGASSPAITKDSFGEADVTDKPEH
ncbi:MAG: sulfatase-like hydrolase/transferase, partial [Actinomycetota bacterium]